MSQHVDEKRHFDGLNKTSLYDCANKWLYISHICMSVVCTYTLALTSRQKLCCRRLPESGTPWSPADSKCKMEHAQVEITQKCPQISLFTKLGAFKFKRGSCQDMSKRWYFCHAMSKKNRPNTDVGLLGTQPNKKMAYKQTKKQKPVSALSPRDRSSISCEPWKQFHFSLMLRSFFFFPSLVQSL